MINLRSAEITSPLTAFGDLRVAELSPIFQYTFEYTVDNTRLFKKELVNGGAVTQANAMGVASSSAVTGSSALLKSFRQAKYRSGLGGLARFTALFETAGVAGTEQLVGLADEKGSSQAIKNGYLIGFVGTTFGIHRFVNDTIITTSLSTCDDPLDGSGASGMTIDVTKLNVFEIRFQYLGAGAVEFWIASEITGKFVLFHTIKYANKFITPSTFMPNFNIMIFVNNGATTSDLVVKTASFAYFIEGKSSPILVHQPSFASSVQTASGVTSAEPLFSIRVKDMYASKSNFIEILLERIGASSEANSNNNLAQCELVIDATLGGTPSWSDINTTDSVVEIDTSATSATGGIHVVTLLMSGKNDDKSENIMDYSEILNRGETLTVIASSANNASVSADVLWKELF